MSQNYTINVAGACRINAERLADTMRRVSMQSRERAPRYDWNEGEDHEPFMPLKETIVHPSWIQNPRPDFAGNPGRNGPSHAGILSLIKVAKEKNEAWADCALAELALLTGKPYKFRRAASYNVERYEIEVAL